MAWLDPFTDQSAAPLTSIRLADARHDAERELEKLRAAQATQLPDSLHDKMDRSDRTALARTLARVGQFALALGDGQAAVQVLTEALQTEPGGAARVSLGQALRMLGQYSQARTEFEAVLAGSPENAALTALALLGIARCACDTGEWEAALSACNKALPILQAEKLTHYEAAARLMQTELYIRMKQEVDAQTALDQADSHLTHAKLHWFRPEWWALKARLALTRGEPNAAEKAARRGLGAVDDRVDVQILPALYRTLAAALERQRGHNEIEDARDARHRSVVAAQTCAAQLELARALFEIGWHYRLYANRPTLRARGSGYLYEAERLFQAMGLSTPLSGEATVPLL